MYTTVIPNEKTIKDKSFWIENKGWSDFELFTRLLDIISNEILMTDILTIEPAYYYHRGDTHSLVIVVKYSTY